MRQAPNRSSRTAVAIGAIISHEPPGVFERVTKSAVMNTLVTSWIARSAAAVGSSVSRPATKVAGPPTSPPTVNLRALGFGVLEICTAMLSPKASVPLPPTSRTQGSQCRRTSSTAHSSTGRGV